MRDTGNTSEKLRLLLIHTTEALVSVASNLLTIGIFFFMQHRFNWSLLQNFLLSAGLGAFYIVGALMAHRIGYVFRMRACFVSKS